MYFLFNAFFNDKIWLWCYWLFFCCHVGHAMCWMQLNILFANHKWTTNILKSLVFCFLKSVASLIFFSNLIHMYLHKGLKKSKIQKVIYIFIFFFKDWIFLFTCVCKYFKNIYISITSIGFNIVISCTFMHGRQCVMKYTNNMVFLLRIWVC